MFIHIFVKKQSLWGKKEYSIVEWVHFWLQQKWGCLLSLFSKIENELTLQCCTQGPLFHENEYEHGKKVSLYSFLNYEWSSLRTAFSWKWVQTWQKPSLYSFLNYELTGLKKTTWQLQSWHHICKQHEFITAAEQTKEKVKYGQVHDMP